MNEERERLESELRQRCAAREWDSAATLLLRAYGAEIFGFLLVAHRDDEQEASEAFSDWTEAMWHGLPTFAWASSARTWAYAIAHKLVLVRRRNAARRRGKMADLGRSGLEAIAERVRTETLSYLRTERRTRLQALRDALSEEERLLLMLRVDRDLAWNEIARILGDDASDEAGLARAAARLRKRFQAIKDRLRELAKREGLIE